ncbi:MAG: M17 family peptidase N-terminal domain-containing protein, partial [Elusimicrobiota bacterium]
MMSVTPIALKALAAEKTDLAVFVYEDAGVTGAKALPNPVKAALNTKLKEEGFKAKAKEVCRVSLEVFGQTRRVHAVGLGKKKGSGPESLRLAAGT